MRRVLRLLAFLVLVLPLGSIATAAFFAWRALSAVKAADEKWSPSWRVLLWARLWSAVYRVPWPFLLSILHNEGASTAREIQPSEEAIFAQAGQDAPDSVYPLGDRAIAKGPSVGPGQVLRINVERLWSDAPSYLRFLVVRPSVLDLTRVGNERAATWVAVQIARESLDAADGDLNEAARIYNGGPKYNAAAVKYAQNADDFREMLS